LGFAAKVRLIQKREASLQIGGPEQKSKIMAGQRENATAAVDKRKRPQLQRITSHPKIKKKSSDTLRKMNPSAHVDIKL
jgi:hypothetical protein